MTAAGPGVDLSVRSDVLPTGAYGVTVTLGADEAWHMDAARALAYGAGCVAAATTANHDAAVIRAFVAGGMPEETASAFVVSDLRPDRPAVDERTAPLLFIPGVSAFTGRPFLRTMIGRRAVGQLSPDELCVHAIGVLTAAAAVDLDAALFRAMRERMGAEEPPARAFVGKLGAHWPGGPS